MLGRAGSLALVEMGLTFIVGLACARLIGLNPEETLIFAVAGSMTSTAIVGQFILARGAPGETARLLVGMLVIEDVAAVGFLIIISSVPAGGLTAQEGLSTIVATALGGFALLTIGFLVARYLAPPAINFLSSLEGESEELPFFFALGLGFGFGVLGYYLGYSAGIGAFIIGLAIRGKHSKYLFREVSPVKTLLVFVFFVYMGSQINPVPALAIWPVLVLVLILLIAAKFGGGVLVGKILRSNNTLKDTEPRLVGSWLVPRGEFSFIIGQAALTAGLITSTVFSILGIVVLVTAVAGPLLQRVSEGAIAPTEHPYRPGTSDP